MKDKIVFINQNSGYLMIDIINAHKQGYQQRAFITGKIIKRNTPLDVGVKVEKIMAYNRTSTVKRLVTWLWGFIQIVFIVKTKYRTAHLYIVSNPPLAPFLPLLCKNAYSLLIFDAYPDALVEYKILKPNAWLVKYWSKANKKIFSGASHLFAISNGMKELLSKYVAKDKIVVSPLWTENSFLKPIPKTENPFIKQHQLEGKFIVMYSGNLGFTHNLEVLLEAAKLVKDNRIVFLIIGEGNQRRSLESKIKVEQINNCTVLPWQEVSMLPYSMAAADIAVVSLDRQASQLSVPSKTYNFMSVGTPLLCIADKASELSSIVDHYGCGKCFSGDNAHEIKEFIEQLISDADLLKYLSEKSLSASKDFDSSNAFHLVAH